MKALIKYLILTIILFSCFKVFSQEQIFFKMDNPRIYYNSGTGKYYVKYDILIRASATGTYLYSTQQAFNVPSAVSRFVTSSIPIVDKGIIAGNNNGFPKYDINAAAWGGSPVIRFAFNVASNVNQMGQAAAVACAAITTAYQILATISLELQVGTPGETANISWRTSSMIAAGLQKKSTDPVSSSPINYVCQTSSPTSFEGFDFTTLYYARIYDDTYGWTQYGVTASPWVDWTAAVNTSVWDTTTSAATIDNAGSKAAILRIHSGARLKIPAGKDLTCTGATEINEPRGLVIEAGASGMGQFIDNGTITYPGTGSARAECYFSQNKWHYLSVPVTSTTVAPYKDLYVKYYREATHDWKYILSTTLDSTLATAMKGYALWSDQTTPPMGNATVKITGNLNTGSLSIPITRTLNGANYDGYNQVGNPYVSAIDLSSSSVTWTQVDEKAWVYNSGAYTVYIKIGGGTRASSYIAPQQGFFVHHIETSTSPGTLAFNNTVRTINSEAFVKSTDELADYLLLTASHPGTEYKDLAAVYFREDATGGYDDVYDAGKMWGLASAPQLYSTIPDYNLTVNALKWTGPAQVVPLAFKCSVSGDYLITASSLESFREGTVIMIEDLKESRSQTLMQNPVYAFSYQAGEDANRFLLHFTNPFFGTDDLSREAIQIYSYEDAVYVKHLTPGSIHGTITLYNMTGMKVFGGQLEDFPLNIFHPDVCLGYYVALVRTGSTVVTGKVFLKQD